MSSIQLWFDTEQFPLYKDGYTLSIQNKEVRNETEAGTIIRDVKRLGVPHLSVSCPVDETWYKKLLSVNNTATVTVKYFDPSVLALATFSGFVENLSFDLITNHTKSYWKATFEVTAY